MLLRLDNNSINIFDLSSKVFILKLSQLIYPVKNQSRSVPSQVVAFGSVQGRSPFCILRRSVPTSRGANRRESRNGPKDAACDGTLFESFRGSIVLSQGIDILTVKIKLFEGQLDIPVTGMTFEGNEKLGCLRRDQIGRASCRERV